MPIQSATRRNRHRQTCTDICTETYRGIQIHTETARYRQIQTETNINIQRHSEPYRDRQTQTEIHIQRDSYTNIYMHAD